MPLGFDKAWASFEKGTDCLCNEVNASQIRFGMDEKNQVAQMKAYVDDVITDFHLVGKC
jgi:hypothetical protein